MPEAVVLRGSYLFVPSHDCRSGDLPTDGTVLKPRAGRGNASATPFITVQRDGSIRGMVIYHPDQLPKGVPAPYPYSVALTVGILLPEMEIYLAFVGDLVPSPCALRPSMQYWIQL